MKRLSQFYILFSLIFIFIIPVGDKAHASTTFPDVVQFKEEIMFLNNKGIIYGYGNGNFGPNNPITRLQAVQMILREMGVNLKDAPNPHFKDVTPLSYGYDAIAKAAELGIISGKGDGRFDPNGTLTRGQMAIILVNAYELKGTSPYSFPDVKKSHYMYPYIDTLASHHITVGGTDGKFRPNEPLKRAHFAAFLARLLDRDFVSYPSFSHNTETIANFAQSVLIIELYDENDELISQGSGFIVGNQLIATNLHVISGGVKAVAITNDGEEFELEGVVTYDEYLDLALVKPAEKIGYPALPLASYNSIKIGEKVVAIGSPYGLQNSVTEGIVSGKQTFRDEFGAVNVIQSTAQITFGSSGGPLFNMKGFVIGMNSFGIEELNFAVTSDYVAQMLQPFNGEFSALQTEAFSDMPEIYFEEEDEPSSNEEEKIPELDEYIPVTPPTPSELQLLAEMKQTTSELFIDVVHDNNQPIIYGINTYGELILFNYETNEVKTLSFDEPAESIFYVNGELYITLLQGEHSSYWWDELQKGAVAIVDTATFEIKNKFNIKIDPYDIVADDNYFYISSGSGQWTTIKSYDKETGNEVSSQMIRQQSSIFLHPSKNRIYAVDSDSSPRDMEVFSINNGVLSPSIDSPYHGDYELIPHMAFSPDGKYIFNNYGTIFASSRLKSTDMQFVTELDTAFYDVAFNNDVTKFYLTIDDLLFVYDYASFTLLDTYELDGEGFYLFNYKGNLIIVGEEIAPKTNLPKTFVLRTNMK
ncbi:S-layer homology domain-containing protein [Lysinibacillus sp. BW-2-10]|uniref:S-layer homology domain-containing protein n=1 Tax=Lysinibacillus sp. BW-2-10 TaxID=2590030 RepID=UPI00117F3528|nr:S-layer homology domain-containing protein [Lysinibacillus sp. BW-2-10]TSI09028.1 trypsin-like serine protease [Lysinibacillus sp. BW-2-10]